MKKIAMVMGVLALGACTTQDDMMETSHSMTAVAPAYLMLTLDEQNIWAGLTEAQRQRGILFVTNGASLVSSLGSR